MDNTPKKGDCGGTPRVGKKGDPKPGRGRGRRGRCGRGRRLRGFREKFYANGSTEEPVFEDEK